MNHFQPDRSKNILKCEHAFSSRMLHAIFWCRNWLFNLSVLFNCIYERTLNAENTHTKKKIKTFPKAKTHHKTTHLEFHRVTLHLTCHFIQFGAFQNIILLLSCFFVCPFYFPLLSVCTNIQFQFKPQNLMWILCRVCVRACVC